MLIDKRYKIEECVGKDATRQALCNVFFDAKAKRLVATDGYILACVPCEAQAGDTEGLISPDALRHARKDAGRNGLMQISAGKALSAGQVTMVRPLEENVGPYPQYQQIMPDTKKGDDQTLTIALDPTLLARLAKAIDASEGVEITIPLGKEGKADGAPMVVQKYKGDPGVRALLMPMVVP